VEGPVDRDHPPPVVVHEVVPRVVVVHLAVGAAAGVVRHVRVPAGAVPEAVVGVLGHGVARVAVDHEAQPAPHVVDVLVVLAVVDEVVHRVVRPRHRLVQVILVAVQVAVQRGQLVRHVERARLVAVERAGVEVPAPVSVQPAISSFLSSPAIATHIGNGHCEGQR